MPSHWQEYEINGSVDKYGELGMAVLSALFNIYVFVYHAVAGPHPKHLLTRAKTVSITFHGLSGMANVLLPIISFFLDYKGDVYDSCVHTLVALDVIHTLTAYYQVSGLFGMRFVMRPSYVAVITMKFAASVYWAFDTTDFGRLKMYYFLISIYGWVRLYYGLFSLIRIFTSHLYSVSVILAGLTCFPLAIGPWFNVVLLFLCVFYKAAYEWREHQFRSGEMTKSEMEIFVDETREKHRHMHLSRPLMQSAMRWIGYMSLTHGNNPRNYSDQEKAMVVFDMVDENGDGSISFVELTKLHRAFGQQTKDARTVLDNVKKKRREHASDAVNFKEFFNEFRDLWEWVFDEILWEIKVEKSIEVKLPSEKLLSLTRPHSKSEPVKRTSRDTGRPLTQLDVKAFEIEMTKPMNKTEVKVVKTSSPKEASNKTIPKSVSHLSCDSPVEDFDSQSPSVFEIQENSLPNEFYREKRTSTMATAVESENEFRSLPTVPSLPPENSDVTYGPVQMEAKNLDLNIVSDFSRRDSPDIKSPKKMLKEFRPESPDGARNAETNHQPVYTTPDGGDIEQEKRLMAVMVHTNELQAKSAPGYSQNELPGSMLNFWED